MGRQDKCGELFYKKGSMNPEEILVALNSCVLKLGAGPIEVGLRVGLREIQHLQVEDLPEELHPKFEQFAKLASKSGHWPLPGDGDPEKAVASLDTEDRYHLCIELLGLHAQYLHWHMNRNRIGVPNGDDVKFL